MKALSCLYQPCDVARHHINLKIHRFARFGRSEGRDFQSVRNDQHGECVILLHYGERNR